MITLGTIHDRNIVYQQYNTSINWVKDFPTRKWCIAIIADEKKPAYFDEIIRKVIDRDVSYICGIGQQSDFIHDLADEELMIRDVERKYLPKHIIMTTGHNNLEEGLWFSIYATENNETEIDTIVILDVTNSAFDNIQELIKSFSLGFIPQ